MRSNGLPATAYVRIRDVDPRLADDVLELLGTAGIAAYANRVLAGDGDGDGARERIYADRKAYDQAAVLLDERLPELERELTGASEGEAAEPRAAKPEAAKPDAAKPDAANAGADDGIDPRVVRYTATNDETAEADPDGRTTRNPESLEPDDPENLDGREPGEPAEPDGREASEPDGPGEPGEHGGAADSGDLNDLDDLDAERRWAEIVAGYDDEAPDPVPRWSVLEDADESVRGDEARRSDEPGQRLGSSGRRGTNGSAGNTGGAGGAGSAGSALEDDAPEAIGVPDRDDDEDLEPFVPPDPAPVPKPSSPAVIAIVLMVGGLVALLVGATTNTDLSSLFVVLGLVALVGGVVGLVTRLRDQPPDDDDDGAVV